MPADSACVCESAVCQCLALLVTAACRMQIQGLPTMVFVGVDPQKPALRTEGLLPAESIKEIIQNELLAQPQAAE